MGVGACVMSDIFVCSVYICRPEVDVACLPSLFALFFEKVYSLDCSSPIG